MAEPRRQNSDYQSTRNAGVSHVRNSRFQSRQPVQVEAHRRRFLGPTEITNGAVHSAKNMQYSVEPTWYGEVPESAEGVTVEPLCDGTWGVFHNGEQVGAMTDEDVERWRVLQSPKMHWTQSLRLPRLPPPPHRHRAAVTVTRTARAPRLGRPRGRIGRFADGGRTDPGHPFRGRSSRRSRLTPPGTHGLTRPHVLPCGWVSHQPAGSRLECPTKALSRGEGGPHRCWAVLSSVLLAIAGSAVFRLLFTDEVLARIIHSVASSPLRKPKKMTLTC